jgi:hypothetical protein
LAVTLPAEVVKELELEKGQRVDVSVYPSTGAVTIGPGVGYIEDGKVTKRFRDLVDSLVESAGPVSAACEVTFYLPVAQVLELPSQSTGAEMITGVRLCAVEFCRL